MDIPTIIFLFRTIMFLLTKTHFLPALLYLEIISLSCYFLTIKVSTEGNGEIIIIYLTIIVLEGVFGLRLLIRNSRKSGGDFLTFY
jgi:hypothetical protein